jgi:CBS domain-containing protein
MAHRTVRELMTKEVVVLPAETNVDEAAKAMRMRDIGDVVVTEGPALAGVVTDRDIVVRAIANGRNPFATRLADIVSRHLVVIRDSASPAEAEELMRQHGVRRLLVCDQDNQLIGVVSLGDLASDTQPESTLAAISEMPANT